jgi:acyl-CoA synthetase (AMP-forming)/AMP-acid ligase II
MLISVCRTKLPAFMVPAKIEIRPGPLPRNPNGKIDRKAISIEFHELFSPKDPAALMEKSR